MENWIWIMLALVAGVLLGGGAVWWLGRNRGDGRSVAELEKENQRFKAEVTDHFVETARLINQMTDSYKAVFDHLSGGAQQLVDPKDLRERLEVEHREVRLHRIGASERPSAPGSTTQVNAGKKPAPAQESGQKSNETSKRPAAETPKKDAGDRSQASNRAPQHESKNESKNDSKGGSEADPLKTRPAQPSASGS